MLTTGQVAKLCGVTPDTVLKWIHNDQLRATRTRGGHYRVHVTDAMSLQQSSTGPSGGASPEHWHSPAPALRCWEFMACGGAPSESCFQCAVYRTRASWCFELRRLAAGARHMSVYCDTECQDCPYYWETTCEKTTVLVVSTDAKFAMGLAANQEYLRILPAHNIYEAGVAIASSKPTFAVIDLETLGRSAAELLEYLRLDRRACGIHTILTVPARKASALSPDFHSSKVVACVQKPFGPADLLRILESHRVEKATPLVSISAARGTHPCG